MQISPVSVSQAQRVPRPQDWHGEVSRSAERQRLNLPRVIANTVTVHYLSNLPEEGN